jgi:carboxylesterase
MNIIRGAEPFYFKGDEVGCLLVHGFTGTPKEMRWLGERLAEDGRTVLGVRLAGHATTPEEMSTTTWHDWYASVVEGYRQLRAECKQVFVLGLSLGGDLVLQLAAHERVAGVVAMATPVHIHDWKIPILRPFRRWIKYWPKGESDLQDPVMRAAHLEYDVMPTACVVSLLDCVKIVERALPRVTAPMLLIHSKQDTTVPPDEMQFIYDHITSNDKEMLLVERGCHIVCEDVERETVLARIRAWLAERSLIALAQPR